MKIVSVDNFKQQASKPAPLLKLKSISKSFARIHALNNVDFDIFSGEVIGLLGDNGAGKSTLIKIISGVLTPDSGQIFADGRPVSIKSYKDAERLGIETIYQDIALVDSMSIFRNMFLGRELCNPLGLLRVREMRRQTAIMLHQGVEISGIRSMDQLVEELSGGQKQAVAIGRAVFFKKQMLLLDEPTSALSVRETEKVLAYVEQLRSEDVSCVFVTHNLYHAYRVCDRFSVMAHGQMIMHCRKNEISLDELTQKIVAS